MSYMDYGYNDFFNRSVVKPINSMSAMDAEVLLEGIEGETILAQGSIKSSNGRMAMDLDGNTFVISDGTAERVRAGLMEDGSYGFRIKDREGKILLNFTDSTNIIQSSNNKMQLDFDKEQARWYDQFNLRVLVGKSAKTF